MEVTASAVQSGGARLGPPLSVLCGKGSVTIKSADFAFSIGLDKIANMLCSPKASHTVLC